MIDQTQKNQREGGQSNDSASSLLNTSYIKTCVILVTGDEILSGKTLDTNSSFLARELEKIGIHTTKIEVVGDSAEALEQAAREGISRADLLISTGGLGPTEDDLSMLAMANVAQLQLNRDLDTVKFINDYFAKTGRSVSPNNYKQADFPEGSLILRNNYGTACGALVSINYDNKPKYLAMLPGPPRELIPMFEDYLKPALLKHVKNEYLNYTFMVYGIGESSLEYSLKDIFKRYPDIKIATYASEGEIQVHLRSINSSAKAKNRLEECVKEIRKILGSNIYAETKQTLAEKILELLRAEKMSVSFAESCTAGLVSASLGSIPGASEVFLGGVVSYSDEVKANILKVSKHDLDTYGAVSEEVCLAMAQGARNQLHSDIAVSITGIAGPGGGSTSKPVGTVWIGLSTENFSKAFCFHFTGDRKRIQNLASKKAFDLIRRYILGLELK